MCVHTLASVPPPNSNEHPPAQLLHQQDGNHHDGGHADWAAGALSVLAAAAVSTATGLMALSAAQSR